MLRPHCFLVLLFLFGVEGFSLLGPNRSRWQRHYQPQRTTSDFSFSFDKRGFFGKMTFDIDIIVPPELRERQITDIDVVFDPSSQLEGKVYITRGGMREDHATLHFETEKDVGNISGYVILESR